MATSRGYSSYRGRTPKWKIFLAVLLVLIIVAAAAAILMMRNFIVYDETGTPQLRLPGAEQVQDKTDQTDLPDVDLDITLQEPEPVPQPALKIAMLAEGPLSLEDPEGASAQFSAQQSEYDAVLVTLKDHSGKVYYDSAAAEAKMTEPAEDTAAALAAVMNKAEHSIGKLACLHDPEVAKHYVTHRGLKNTGGYIFYDGNNSQWLDPAKEGTRAYLAKLAAEAAELGFDEVLLSDVSYPTTGKLEKIRYGEGTQTEHIAALLQEIRAALPEGVLLSVELPAEVIRTGLDEAAGQDLSVIAPLVDRIYAETTQSGAQNLAEKVSAAGDAEFIAILTHLPQENIPCAVPW